MKTLVGITAIETAFYNMGKTNPELQEYFFTYYSQKLILLNHFYPHVEGVLSGFTDHGPKHIIRIMKLYEKMLENNIPILSDSQEVPSSAALNFYETYLLLCATVWHDIALLLGEEYRNVHNEEIQAILSKIQERLENNYFVDSHMEKYSMQIAKAHSGEDAIQKFITREDLYYHNEEINLRFLGAVLRLADELDEGVMRIDEKYYETMKESISEDHHIYWEISRSIKRISINPDDCKIEIRAEINQDDLFKIYRKKDKDVALIDELIFRVDKMNQERMYYMKFVRKHVDYNEIVFDLTVENATLSQFTFRFNNDQGYDAFWNNYPMMNPKNEIDGYILQKEVEK